jgi:hypothetical protein
VETEIARLGYTVSGGYLRLVLDVTGGAHQSIDILQAFGIARVLEFAARVRIERFFAVLTMTVDTRLLDHLATAERVRVAGAAGDPDLVMPAT